MDVLIDWLRTTGLGITFLIFIAGICIRLTLLYRLSKKKDKIIYNHADVGWAVRSIGHWLLPLASHSMRTAPLFSTISYIFHVLIITLPCFLLAHNILLKSAFGFCLPSLSNANADIMTVCVIACGVFLLLRRIALEEVRIISARSHYSILVLTLLPFVTGYAATHGIGPYKLLLLLHILSGEVLLIALPFSKLSHFILFFFTRAFIGFEMGERRGARPW
jgi:nitrate reductase gamma subunit